MSSERPQANVPFAVLTAENFLGYNGALFCNQSATYNNLTCSNPPEQVNITWMTQNVVEINTKDTTHTLNFYLKVQWRDWRLAYAEGGVTCFESTTAPIPLGGSTSYDISAVQAALLAALLDAWGCDSSGCYPYLPRGVWPRATLAYADASNSSVVASVFPAPNFLFAPGGPDGTTVEARAVAAADQLYAFYGPSAAACVRHPCSSAEQYAALLFDALTATGDAALMGARKPAATSRAFLTLWPKTQIPCTGIRRTPSYLILVGERQADQVRAPRIHVCLGPRLFLTHLFVV